MDPGIWRRDFFGQELDIGTPPIYRREKIPIGWIIALPQPRQTFEGIEELALDIAQSGFLYPPIVCVFDGEFFVKYLEVINRIWGTDFNSEHLPQGADGKIYVLIDGERRIRAAKHLLDHGCEICGLEGGCFEKHFPGGTLELTICRNISPHKAISIQFRANMHMAVPPCEEAEALARNWRFIKQVDPSFPLARFAREVGRSAETVRNAVKFCNLPEEIQKMVQNRIIPYGIALELARGMENKIKNLDFLLTDALVRRQKVSDFRQTITDQIAALESGQQSLDLIFDEIEEEERRQRGHGEIAGRELRDGALAFIYYCREIFRLFEEGMIKTKYSPFGKHSSCSPTNIILRELIRVLRGPLSDHFKVIHPVIYEETEKFLRGMEILLDQVEKESAA